MNSISKKVRELIFANRIWKPRGIQNRERKKSMVNSNTLCAKQMFELCFLEYSIFEKTKPHVYLTLLGGWRDIWMYKEFLLHGRQY